jgi:hypothetical protein
VAAAGGSYGRRRPRRRGAARGRPPRRPGGGAGGRAHPRAAVRGWPRRGRAGAARDARRARARAAHLLHGHALKQHDAPALVARRQERAVRVELDRGYDVGCGARGDQGRAGRGGRGREAAPAAGFAGGRRGRSRPRPRARGFLGPRRASWAPARARGRSRSGGRPLRASPGDSPSCTSSPGVRSPKHCKNCHSTGSPAPGAAALLSGASILAAACCCGSRPLHHDAHGVEAVALWPGGAGRSRTALGWAAAPQRRWPRGGGGRMGWGWAAIERGRAVITSVGAVGRGEP